MNWKRGIRKIFLWLGLGTAALTLCVAALFAFIQTDTGCRELVRLVEHMLSKEKAMRVKIGTAKGLLPFDFELDHLAVGDGKGTWLSLEDLLVAWSPLDMLKGQIRLREVRIVSLRLERLPEERKKVKKGPVKFPRWIAVFERLKVEHLSVGNFSLGEGVLGEEAAFRLEANVMAALGREEWITSLRIERADGPAAHVEMKATLLEKGPYLTLEVEGQEAPGGLIASRLGIQDPLTLSLRGEGPLQRWKGKTKVQAGKRILMEGEMTFASLEDLRLNAEAILKADPAVFPDPVAVWLGPSTHLVFMGRVRKGESFTLDTLLLETGSISLDLSGSSDLKEQSLHGRFDLRSTDLSPLGRSLDRPAGGTLRAEGTVSGTLLRPRASLVFQSDDLQVDQVRVTRVNGEIFAEFLDGRRNPGPLLRLTGKGQMAGVSTPDPVHLPDSDLKWGFAAQGSPADVVRVNELTLEGEKGCLRLSGEVAIRSRKGKFQVGVDVKTWEALTKRMGFAIPGAVHLRADVEGDLLGPSLSADVRGKLDFRDRGHPEEAFPIKDLEYAGRIVLRQGQEIAVSDARLSSAPGDLTGNGRFDLASGRWTGVALLIVHDLKRLSPFAGFSMAGFAEVEASAHGSREGINLGSKARGAEIRIGGVDLGRTSLHLNVEGLPMNTEGSFRFTIREQAEGISGQARFALVGSRLQLKEILMKGPGESRGMGTVVLDLGKTSAEGNLSVACPELSSFSKLLGRNVQGRADLRMTLGGGEMGLPVRFTVEGKHLRGSLGEAKELQLQGVLKELSAVPEGSAKLQVKDLRLKGVHVPVLELSTEGTGDRISFSGSAKGRLDRSFEVETAGLLSPNRAGTILRVDKLDGRYGDLPIQLARAAVLERSMEGLFLRSAEFLVGGAPLSGSGRFGAQDMDIALKIEDLPVNFLRPAGVPTLQGSVSGELRVKGPLDRPKGTSHIRIHGLRVNDPQLEGIPPASLEAQAHLEEGRVQGEVVLSGLTPAPFVSQVEMPLRLSLAPFFFALPAGGEVKGRLSGKADLARMGEFVGLDDQSFGGVLDVSLQLEGTVEDPRLTGGLSVEKGTYENIRFGTILRHIEMKIVAETPMLVIERAKASDGEKGTLSMEGWLDARAEKRFPLHGILVLNEAKLVRHDAATGTANGRLHLEGTVGHPKLTGEIEITEADLKLPKRFSRDIPELEVVEIHGPGKKKEEGSAERVPAGASMELDVSMKSPGRVFLSGRGLDSEWKGDLRITGTTREPVIAGGLSVVRGHFNFLDRPFDLRQGKITFNGMSPPSPFVDALAEASSRDIKARLRLLGPLRSPELKLSSDPPLPSDEVLSHLLFGRGVSSISPVQAIQLAQALNLLAGGDTFDLLGQTRRFLGVDQLEVKQSGDRPEDTSVAAGKYLGKNVYLELEKELGPKGPKASLNWEITPHLSIQSEVGTDEEGGIGVNWKWDY